jgi:hypothetical protein
MVTGGLTQAHWDLIRKLLDWLRSISKREGGSIGDQGCCHLGANNECVYYLGDKSTYICPEGYYKHWWYCVEGRRRFVCGEGSSDEYSCVGSPHEVTSAAPTRASGSVSRRPAGAAASF